MRQNIFITTGMILAASITASVGAAPASPSSDATSVSADAVATAETRAAAEAPKNLLRVAVLDFENKVPGSLNDVGSGMAEMLIRELKKTGRYTVLERAALAEVLGEQDFTNSGRAQRGQQIATGRVKGAQLLIKGAVTEFSYNVSNRNAGIGFGGFGIGVTQAKARIAADIRLIDPMTGEIVKTHDQAAEIKSSGANVAGTLQGFSFSGGGSENHPMGQAVRQLIGEMTAFITKTLDTGTIEILVTQKFEGRVVKAESADRIVINRGISDGVKVGDRFRISRVTEELVDPESGEMLGETKLTVGTIEITRVENRWSEGRVIEGEGFMANDRVTR